LEQVIGLAQERSLDAMVAKNSFLGDHWNYRSHRAELLPSLNVSADLVNFDRSQKPMQDANTGEIKYLENYNMTNTGTISIDQNISATGGTLAFSSSLDRLDQYSPAREVTYSARPMSLTYLQPLWTYNRLKWDKQIEPERYEQARKEYVESMENITIKAVQYYFNFLIAQKNHEIAVQNYSNTRTMYGIANRRFNETGTVTKNELLQLELRMITDSLSISTQDKNRKASMISLSSFLDIDDDTEIDVIATSEIPDVTLDYNFVIEKVLSNSSFLIEQKITRLEAERAVAQAKANRGISVSLNARFGLSNNDDKIRGAYSNLMNYQVFGLSLRVPIMDWGMGKGRVQMAEAQMKTSLFRQEQNLNDHMQTIYLDVLEFNTQREQLRMAARANDIATQRYDLTMQDFAAGTVSVTELNTAQSEKESASMNYLSEMSRYWSNYYKIRKLSLYDYINNTDIIAEIDNIIN
jgi:outer membrane protein TolC